MIKLIQTQVWEQLSAQTNTAFTRSNYIWLGIVPATAKVLEKVGDEIQIAFGGAEIIIVMDLPFSWHLFYWGAVFFVIAHITYLSFCPAFIRNYKNFEDYKRMGYAVTATVDRYRKEPKFKSRKIDSIIDGEERAYDAPSGFNSPEEETEVAVFYHLMESYNEATPKARLICTWALRAGYVLFGIVFAQNLIFVFKTLIG